MLINKNSYSSASGHNSNQNSDTFLEISDTDFLRVTWLVVTEVQSESFGLGTELHHDIGVLCAVTHTFAYWMSPVSVTHVIFFVVECGMVHFLCVYSTFRHHPHRLGYLCANFRFCRGPRSWASRWRKIAYSITHSLNHQADLMCREPKPSLRNKRDSSTFGTHLPVFSPLFVHPSTPQWAPSR